MEITTALGILDASVSMLIVLRNAKQFDEEVRMFRSAG
jgi:hypothetical protein